MDVRHQVFVSSTYVDLVDERREVIQALLELDCIPAGMELFPAANEEQWELIKAVIDQSDYYVVIIGGRYGSTTAEGISYTEKEYDYAVAKGIPVAGFVHENPDEIPIGKSEIDAIARERLDAFRAKVRERMVKTYSDAASLGSVVSRSLTAQMRRHPRPGWVRGENAMTPEVRTEIAELRAQLAERERAEAVKASSEFVVDNSLRQGDDDVELEFTYNSGSYMETREFDVSWEPSWDDLMRAIGPLLFDEGSETEMRGAVGAAALMDLWDTPAWVRILDPQMLIKDSSWGRVLVQLRALGYIETGTKKRTVRDRTIWWKLTPAGDARLVTLLAERRDSNPA